MTKCSHESETIYVRSSEKYVWQLKTSKSILAHFINPIVLNLSRNITREYKIYFLFFLPFAWLICVGVVRELRKRKFYVLYFPFCVVELFSVKNIRSTPHQSTLDIGVIKVLMSLRASSDMKMNLMKMLCSSYNIKAHWLTTFWKEKKFYSTRDDENKKEFLWILEGCENFP